MSCSESCRAGGPIVTEDRPSPVLPANLTEAQLSGRACVRCGDEHSTKWPVEAWSELSSQLFECVDVENCADRRGLCAACGHEWRWHTRGGMCQGTAEGIECHCVMIRPAESV